MERTKVTVLSLHDKMARKQKISMLTCYDFPTAILQERAGVDIILVGDSMGMVVLGYESTLPVTMDAMVLHAKAVRKGAPHPFLIGDMPYMSYQVGTSEAIRNAGRFMAEAGCDGVKLEGGSNVIDTVAALTKATIPVMGHIGLTPQSMSQLGGFKAQGRDAATGKKLIDDAKALEDAGAFSILLEAIPPEVAAIITERASIPIISIGSGPNCHGQLLIVHDMLGFFDQFTPKFVKKYADLNGTILSAFQDFIKDVDDGSFPAPEHCYTMRKGEADKLKKLIEE